MYLQQQEKPVIVVLISGDAGFEAKRALLSGIEEEMIPYRAEETGPGDIRSLSYEAANASRLGVGVALARDAAALHYEKMPPLKPVFMLGRDDMDGERLHSLGANAARLVKGVAFKELT